MIEANCGKEKQEESCPGFTLSGRDNGGGDGDNGGESASSISTDENDMQPSTDQSELWKSFTDPDRSSISSSDGSDPNKSHRKDPLSKKRRSSSLGSLSSVSLSPDIHNVKNKKSRSVSFAKTVSTKVMDTMAVENGAVDAKKVVGERDARKSAKSAAPASLPPWVTEEGSDLPIANLSHSFPFYFSPNCMASASPLRPPPLRASYPLPPPSNSPPYPHPFYRAPVETFPPRRKHYYHPMPFHHTPMPDFRQGARLAHSRTLPSSSALDVPTLGAPALCPPTASDTDQSAIFSVPEAMVLSLPNSSGREPKMYKVKYEVYRMSREQVQPFLDSYRASVPPPTGSGSSSLLPKVQAESASPVTVAAAKGTGTAGHERPHFFAYPAL